MRGAVVGAALLFPVLVAGSALAAAGATSADATAEAALTLSSVDARLPALEKAARSERVTETTRPVKRMESGKREALAGNYPAAIAWFSQVVELGDHGRASAEEHAAALMALTDAFVESQQLGSVAPSATALLSRAGNPVYQPYAARALARLVEAGLRGRNPAALEEAVRQGEAAAASGVPAAYFTGKALVGLGRYDEALSWLDRVPPTSPSASQAGYLRGVVLTKLAARAARAPGAPVDYSAPLAQFERVAAAPASAPDAEVVRELAALAVGRLLYESGKPKEALAAYQRVGSASPAYNEALQEVAWVHVALGDFPAARAALDALAARKPTDEQVAEAGLLRGDIELRAGKLDEAKIRYTEVRLRYEPLARQTDFFLTEVVEPVAYYDRFVGASAGASLAGPPLPEVALEWARQGETGEGVFSVIADVGHSRRLVAEGKEKAEVLLALLGGPGRVRAFPQVFSTLQDVVADLNRVAHARLTLARGLDSLEQGPLGPELAQVAAERRALMGAIADLPADEAALARRSNVLARQWARAGRDVDWLDVELDSELARLERLRRGLAAPDAVRRIPASERAVIAAELDAVERELAAERTAVGRLGNVVKVRELEVGVASEESAADDAARKRFGELLEREAQLAVAGQGGEALAAYARAIHPLLVRADNDETRLLAIAESLELDAATRASELAASVTAEAQALAMREQQLAAFDAASRVALGEAARRQVGVAGERLGGIVMRAELGNAQQAWQVRENARERLMALQRERDRLQKYLDGELREVIEDAGSGR